MDCSFFNCVVLCFVCCSVCTVPVVLGPPFIPAWLLKGLPLIITITNFIDIYVNVSIHEYFQI